MKSYTDLEQSKKLAEILPLESADMYFEPSAGFCTEPSEVKVGDIKYAHPRSIPCWSLASLLEYLRKIDFFPDIIDSVDCVLMDISFADDEDGKVLHPIHCLRVEGKTILDACVEMILKLHEKKLL